MKKSLKKAFEVSLEKVQSESLTIEDCIVDYPEHKDELSELLQIVRASKKLSHIKPAEAFSKNATQRLLSKILETPQTLREKLAIRFNNKFFRPVRRFSMSQIIITIIVSLSMLLGGSYAIEAAGPGDVLYKFDRNLEKLYQALALDTEMEIILRNHFATERLKEAENKINNGKLEETVAALNAYNQAVLEIIELVSDKEMSLTQEEIREMSQEEISKQAGILDRIRLSWPGHDTKYRNAYQKSFRIANMGFETLSGPPDFAPLGPNDEAPLGPNNEAPQGPNEEAPQGPNDEAPQGPNEEAPQAPNEEAPQAPNEEAPQAPNEEAPQAPNEEAPQAPNEEAPQEPNEDAPQAPDEEAPQGPNDDAPQGPTKDSP